jgi:hypothetical protein
MRMFMEELRAMRMCEMLVNISMPGVHDISQGYNSRICRKSL